MEVRMASTALCYALPHDAHLFYRCSLQQGLSYKRQKHFWKNGFPSWIRGSHKNIIATD